MTTEPQSDQRSPASAPASAHQHPPAVPPRRVRRSWGGWLFALLVLAGLAVGGWWGWQWYAREQQKLPALRAALDQQALAISGLTRQLTAERGERQQLATRVERTNNELQLQINAQAKRLADLSASGRDDWALAEAEYLLRLANQRLLTERQSKGAIALLAAADAILRDFDDSALFPVREALTREITALQLAGAIDREGLYLRLAALAEVVIQLQPTEFADIDSESSPADEEQPEHLPWYRQLLVNARAAFDRFAAEHFQVKSLAKPLEPLLTPNQDVYLRHNVRLGIEQAQFALLREEQEIYTTSLDKAESWLRTYFSGNADADVVAEQLATLKTQVVVQKLPDVSASLTALRDYINRRHQRRAAAGAGMPPAETAPIEPAPTETAPTEAAPTEAAPTETGPADARPMDNAPVDSAP